MSDVSDAVVVGAATVGASLIAGLITFVNLVLSKDQEVSRMRNSWSEAVRDNLSMYLASVGVLVNYSDEIAASDAGKKVFAHKRTQEEIDRALFLASEALERIRLRLNPLDTLHTRLESELLAVRSCYHDWKDGEEGLAEAMCPRMEALRVCSREVFKAEWERVKQGESTFQALKWLTAPFILLILGSLSALVYFYA